MHEAGLLFLRAGRTRKLYRVSPLLFPQFGTYNKFLLPKNRDLPAHGLITRFYAFDFGYSQLSQAIAPYDTAYCPLVVGRDLLVWSITRTYSTVATADPPVAGTPGANASPGFLVNFIHEHQGVQRQWCNKSVSDGEFGGNGAYPMVLKDPALLPQGDTIICQITNLLNATMLAQVVFSGGEFDTEAYGQEAGV